MGYFQEAYDAECAAIARAQAVAAETPSALNHHQQPNLKVVPPFPCLKTRGED